MNIEQEIIRHLWHSTEEFPKLSNLVTSYGIKFSLVNSGVYQYLLQYTKKYGKRPSLKLLTKEFKDFTWELPEDPLEFYFNEWKELHKQNSFNDLILEAQKKMINGGVDSALAYLKLSTSSMKIDTPEVDLDLKTSIESQMEKYTKKQSNPEKQGILTGIKSIDLASRGFSKGDYVPLVAQPKSFKTWVFCYMFLQQGLQGKKSIFFSKEMTQDQIWTRCLAIAAELNWNKVQHLQLEDDDKKKAIEVVKQISGELIIIGKDVADTYNLDFIRKKYAQYSGFDSAFVDGVYLFADTPDWKDQMTFSIGLRDVCLQSEIMTFATMQMNRKNEVALTQELERDCTAMYFLHRLTDDIDKNQKLPKIKITCPFAREFEEGFVEIGENGEERHVSETFVTIDFKSTKILEGNIMLENESWGMPKAFDPDELEEV